MLSPFNNKEFMEHLQGEVFHIYNHSFIHPKEVREMQQSDKDMLKVFDFDGAAEISHFGDSNDEMFYDIVQWHYKQWKKDRLYTSLSLTFIIVEIVLSVLLIVSPMLFKWVIIVDDPMAVLTKCLIWGAFGIVLASIGVVMFTKD